MYGETNKRQDRRWIVRDKEALANVIEAELVVKFERTHFRHFDVPL
jgi:hypothetical protein